MRRWRGPVKYLGKASGRRCGHLERHSQGEKRPIHGVPALPGVAGQTEAPTGRGQLLAS